MVWADIIKIAIAGGFVTVMGTVIVALLNGAFGRGETKATAAKMVAESTKIATDMVREISDDLRKDNDELRDIAERQTALIETLTRRVEALTERLDQVTRATKTAIPMIALQDPVHAELLTDLLSETNTA